MQDNKRGQNRSEWSKKKTNVRSQNEISERTRVESSERQSQLLRLSFLEVILLGK